MTVSVTYRVPSLSLISFLGSVFGESGDVRDDAKEAFGWSSDVCVDSVKVDERVGDVDPVKEFRVRNPPIVSTSVPVVSFSLFLFLKRGFGDIGGQFAAGA